MNFPAPVQLLEKGLLAMPMNQFLFDHQMAAMKVDKSGSTEERSEAFEKMGSLAKRMATWRKTNGLSDLGWPHDQRPPPDEAG